MSLFLSVLIFECPDYQASMYVWDDILGYAFSEMSAFQWKMISYSSAFQMQKAVIHVAI